MNQSKTSKRKITRNTVSFMLNGMKTDQSHCESVMHLADLSDHYTYVNNGQVLLRNLHDGRSYTMCDISTIAEIVYHKTGIKISVKEGDVYYGICRS